MLNDFVHPEGALYIGDKGARKAIAGVRKVLEEFRRSKEPIIFVCDFHEENDVEFQRWPKHAVKGSWGAEIIGELSPLPDEMVVFKKRYDAFIGTPLDLILRDLKVDEIYVVGVATNICVLYTVAHASMLGYRVKVVEEAVASFDEERHKQAIRDMREVFGAEII